jgi:glycosyltransferase involved in cell wall biosynthesis
MNILVPVSTQLLNPYPREIYEHLMLHKKIDCTFSNLKFWLPDFYAYDIIHIHWPENLTTNLLNTDFIVGGNNFKAELFAVNETLKKWKAKNTKIVLTYHNEKPHGGNNEFSNLLYDMIYNYADSVIHLGEYSMHKYLSLNKKPEQENLVIPHSIYNSYPNTATKIESRQKLKINKDAFIILVFGAVRNQLEAQFILDTFENVDHKKKLLLAPRWNIEDFTKYGRLLGKIKEKIFNLKMFFKSNMYLKSNRTSVLADDVQYYFNASDVVLIPRIDTINSGILPLSATFKRAVISPDVGNIGEQVKLAGFNTFEPGNAIQAGKIINEIAAKKSQEEIGQTLYAYASKNWDIETVAAKHYHHYENLLNKLNA